VTYIHNNGTFGVLRVILFDKLTAVGYAYCILAKESDWRLSGREFEPGRRAVE